jgi:lipopolysaccharide export system protein LptA
MKNALFLAVTSAVVASALIGYAGNAQLLSGHNSDAPVNFSADRIEVQDRADRVLVSGNVHVTQADLTLDSARMIVAYHNGSGVEIDRIDASGGVHITRGQDKARGDVAIYDLNRRLITMLGSVELTQGTNHLTGGRLVMDLASGRSTVDGQSAAGGVTNSGGRVSGTFTVPKREAGQQ